MIDTAKSKDRMLRSADVRTRGPATKAEILGGKPASPSIPSDPSAPIPPKPK